MTKKIPIVWSVGEVKRVLNTQLSYRDKVLVLLYDSYPNSVLDTELFRWVEHSTLTYFRRDVLRPCHKDKLIEYDQGKGKVVLSPLGLDHVEKNIKLEF